MVMKWIPGAPSSSRRRDGLGGDGQTLLTHGVGVVAMPLEAVRHGTRHRLPRQLGHANHLAGVGDRHESRDDG